jgi:hypothetical protein
VSQGTITADLRGLLVTNKPLRPKGGRPKGSGKTNKLHPQRRMNNSPTAETAAEMILDGKSYSELEKETGLSNTVLRSAVARVEGRREATPIDPASLSLTAQQKLQTAIRQHQHKLDLQFEQRVQQEYQDRLNEFLPDYHKKLADADAVVKARSGVMSRRIYRKIWACLHPDEGASKELLAEAFKIFAKLEPVLVKEEEMPTPKTIFPRTYAEMMELKRATSEARKARRSSNKQATVRA